MRATLMEVLDPARGEAMYTIEWLVDRVRQHLDGRHVGAVFVAEDDGEIVGHTIVRIEHDAARGTHGLFSTVYVVPTARRKSAAVSLLERGEAWLREHEMSEAATWTATTNVPLHELFARLGYSIVEESGEMVRLWKRF
jgi:N-acetylglutamate synthase-like GNAT family acetyltransferase